MLLVLINQFFCDYLIDAKQMSSTLFTNFSTELKKQIGSLANSLADKKFQVLFSKKSLFH